MVRPGHGLCRRTTVRRARSGWVSAPLFYAARNQDEEPRNLGSGRLCSPCTRRAGLFFIKLGDPTFAWASVRECTPSVVDRGIRR
jgi:hypothetical protein